MDSRSQAGRISANRQTRRRRPAFDSQWFRLDEAIPSNRRGNRAPTRQGGDDRRRGGLAGRKRYRRFSQAPLSDWRRRCMFVRLRFAGIERRRCPQARWTFGATSLKQIVASADIMFSAHFENGAALFTHAACKFGLEGIVSKRRDLPYRSGKSTRWLKIKNPPSPAMLRLVE
jgi:hypothetical protein